MDRNHIIRRFIPANAPRRSNRGDHNLNPNMGNYDKLVPAAVLIPLVERHQGITTLLTQRTAHLENHPGQISFPGGHVEPSDNSAEETALRETEEEVGLNRSCIQVLGRLDQYRVRTGFEITPVVGLVTPPFKISPDEYEVAKVFEVPLSYLMEPMNYKRESRKFEGKTRCFYAINYNGYYIWGATAGMLINLQQVLTETSFY